MTIGRHFQLCLTLGVALSASTLYAADWFQLPFGQSANGNQPVASNPATDGSGATIRVLDKNTNRIRDISLKAGQTSPTPLRITLRRCVRDVDGVPNQDVAWLDILNPTDNAPLFNGWMFNVYPDVATLEHPRYDVRLISCQRTGQPAKPKATVQPQPPAPPPAAPEAPLEDFEADPNYVQGLEQPTNPLHQLMDDAAF